MDIDPGVVPIWGNALQEASGVISTLTSGAGGPVRLQPPTVNISGKRLSGGSPPSASGGASVRSNDCSSIGTAPNNEDRKPSGVSLVAQVGASFVQVLGAEGYTGVYMTLPTPNGADFDIGAYASGGIAAGWNVDVGATGGWIKGDVNAIRGITLNANTAVAPVGGTLMFDKDGNRVGQTFGPTAGLGGSGSYARTGALSLRELLGLSRSKSCAR
jgi:hypothetical protein